MKNLKTAILVFSIIIIIATLFIVDYSALISRQNLAPLLIIITSVLNVINAIFLHKNTEQGKN